ncbi:uncharacterized protein TNCV_3551861 [Trichonephila clavipes]|nr:uncharacterized protein TNCV_3551861 [Trichonephila clavipes]
MKTPATFTNVSPFLIEKAITSSIGEVKSICKVRSGDLFLEVSSSNQATALKQLKNFAHLDVSVVPHSSLSFSRGVISPADFLNVSDEEILENMKAQKVWGVRRITIRWDGNGLNTKHLNLTFSKTDLPQNVKMAYIRCPVRPYVPNPLHCFQCQRYGHSKNVCRVQPTCPRCEESDHDKTRRVVLSRPSVSGKSDASVAQKTFEHEAKKYNAEEDVSSDTVAPTKLEVIATSKSNSSTKTKVIAKPTSQSLPPAKKLIKRAESDSPKNPKSRRDRQRDQSPTFTTISKKVSREFHRKIEDTVTGDCSEDDEDLIDIQLRLSTSSSRGGASEAQL